MPFLDIILIPFSRSAARSGRFARVYRENVSDILIELPPFAATPIVFSHLQAFLDYKNGSRDRSRAQFARRGRFGREMSAA
jgi:hypothetical protein